MVPSAATQAMTSIPPPPPANPSPLHFAPLQRTSLDHHHHRLALAPGGGAELSMPGPENPPSIGRVRLSDITPYEGSPDCLYLRAVAVLSGSLMRHNAAVIELGPDDSAIIRCALDSARWFFGTLEQCGKRSQDVFVHRAGRPSEEGDMSPPCMNDAFKTMGKASRAALCAIARHLRLRSDVFNHLLDDSPLPSNEVSSSLLVATHSIALLDGGRGVIGPGKSTTREVEKGLLTLIASNSPGTQVCDPNGRWYLADGGLGPGELLLLTGRSLSHVTAGLRPAAFYKVSSEYSLGCHSKGRVSLAFRLMPLSNAILDCSSIAAAGHVIPQSFVPISVSQFMDDISTDEDAICNRRDIDHEAHNHLIREPSLRSVLSDPLSGAFLEDAVVVSCGHSFGGHMLKKVIEMARCTLCSSEIEIGCFIPNYALRAAASVVKFQDDRRLFHNAALRKRRKEAVEHMDLLKKLNKDHGELGVEGDSPRLSKGVQYPFQVNEKVTIKGNRRTPDKFVGKEAIITSQCLNGWYLLKILESGESVRLQYRSLQKLRSLQIDDNSCQPLPLIDSGN